MSAGYAGPVAALAAPIRLGGRPRVMELLSPFAEFLRVHAAWTGPVTAAACLLITLPGIGLLMPAAAVMLLVGSLIGVGAIPGEDAFLGSLLGTVVGTSLGHEVGRWSGPAFLRRRPLRRHRRQVARARLFFRRQGTLALLLSRFLGPLRCIAPFVAGTMRMPRRRFEAVNVLSAVLWVAVMLAPGWLTLKNRANLLPAITTEIAAPPRP
ncbi:DedA family protein [Aureimonas jatrophae]|uniref:DedA family protein n=1 Tax=Aureimonas jatrophae TaxID=1166073 RepID=UPI000B81C425|nr:DedA family protein [Aureimonas jatrophae]